MNSIKRLNAYCESLTSPVSPVLEELERETHLKTLSPQMLCGRLQGQLLRLLSELKKPGSILEIGTFTGYASICLAMGLPENGVLHTIEVNPELTYLSRKYFEKTGLQQKIRLYAGNAKEIIPTLPGPFDIVFIDAGKDDYTFYYDLVFDKVNPGGLILADNVLWDGKVASKASDKDTRTLQEFNRKVHSDSRVEVLMLPVRDGIMIARKL
jgi:predicted O-methyltransferase YrrM